MRFRLPLLAAALTALLAVVPGAQAADPLQPGDSMRNCTLNFVYDGTGALAGKVYMGTAAHCVSGVGQQIRDGAGRQFGAVAFIGNANQMQRDYAFIEVNAAHVGLVSPAVKGHGAYPTGVAQPDDTFIGDVVQLSGYGMVFGSNQVTQEQRRAILELHEHEYYTVAGPLIFGDSGGPLVHAASGRALGIVSRLCTSHCTEVGPTVSGLLADAAARGFTVQLRTV